MCRSVCLCLYKAHAHSDCCEAMHAHVGVYVLTCTGRMLSDVMHRVCFGLCRTYAHCDCCKAMHVCRSVGV
jgi:hypothetical protein